MDKIGETTEKVAHIILEEMALLWGEAMAAQTGRIPMPSSTMFVKRANATAEAISALYRVSGEIRP